jgi:hypothetical protein
MAQIAEFRLPSGDVVLVEAEDEPPAEGEQRAGIGDTLNRLRRGSNEQPVALQDRVQPLAQALLVIRETLSGAVTAPEPPTSSRPATDIEEIVLQAGLKFVGEAGLVMAKVGTEANISIALKWKPDGSTPAQLRT